MLRRCDRRFRRDLRRRQHGGRGRLSLHLPRRRVRGGYAHRRDVRHLRSPGARDDCGSRGLRRLPGVPGDEAAVRGCGGNPEQHQGPRLWLSSQRTEAERLAGIAHPSDIHPVRRRPRPGCIFLHLQGAGRIRRSRKRLRSIEADVRRGRPVRGLGRVLLAWAILVAKQSVGGTDQQLDVHYQADTLTLRVEHIPLQQLLEELSRQTGAEIVGTAPSDRVISAEFSALPLPIALSRVLAPVSFALRYRSTGELQSIHILGPGGAPSPAAAPQPSPQPPGGVAAVRRLGAPLAPPGPAGAAAPGATRRPTPLPQGGAAAGLGAPVIPPAPGTGVPQAGAPPPGATSQPTPPQRGRMTASGLGAPAAPAPTSSDEPPPDAALADPAYVPSDGANLPGEH